FPLIVFLDHGNRYDAKIIDFNKIEQFKKNIEPSLTYSFLIPHSQEDFVQERLSVQDSPLGSFDGFKVINISPGNQYIKVKVNYINKKTREVVYVRSWYEATSKSISPKYHIEMDFDIAGGFVVITYFILAFPVLILFFNLIIYFVKLFGKWSNSEEFLSKKKLITRIILSIIAIVILIFLYLQ
ncbi:unnamed protein product, partial [marine sediment metagenome]